MACERRPGCAKVYDHRPSEIAAGVVVRVVLVVAARARGE